MLQAVQQSASVIPVLTLTFDQKGDYAAYSAAQAFLEQRGFSLGRMQARSPSGILFGRFDIQKWRNLNDADRDALHGCLTGSFREGPVTVEIFAAAPADAITAFRREV